MYCKYCVCILREVLLLVPSHLCPYYIADVSQTKSSRAEQEGDKSTRRTQWQWRCFECSESFADYNVYKLHARLHSFKSLTCELCHRPLYTIENPDIHTCLASPSTFRGRLKPPHIVIIIIIIIVIIVILNPFKLLLFEGFSAILV